MTGQQMTGAQALVESLEHAGAEVVFGLPGGAILPTYDPLMDAKKLRHVLVRHEQGAGHAASGYAHATGKVGVCLATSGPGATNLITAIADAQMDSIPLVAITGQVGSMFIGTDAFQEADIVGMTMPVTKHNFLVKDAAEIPKVIKQAFHIASTGRPGAVLVDVTKDAQQDMMEFVWPETLDLPGYRPEPRPHGKQIREAVRLMLEAKRPVFLLGGGVLRGNASDEVRELVDSSGIPFTTTLMARGALPDSHPSHLGMPGMHGTVAAVSALQRADLLINIGARFDDRVTGRLDSFAPGAKIIHADIDPAEISKNLVADVPIVGQAGQDVNVLVGDLDLQRAVHRGGLHLGERTHPRQIVFVIVGEVAGQGAFATEDGNGFPGPEENRFVVEIAAQREVFRTRGDDLDGVDPDFLPECEVLVFVLVVGIQIDGFDIAVVVGIGDVVGVDLVLPGGQQFRLGQGHRLGVHGGDTHHRIDRIQHIVPALGHCGADLIPQFQALAADEHTGAAGQCPERGVGGEELRHGLEFADLADIADHGQRVLEFGDGIHIQITGSQLGGADQVERVVVLGLQFRGRQPGDNLPGRMVDQIVIGIGPDEGRQFGHGFEAVEGVLVS